MPKRKNPFGGAPSQLKTHVSSKHVASQEDMEEIYSEYFVNTYNDNSYWSPPILGKTRERLFHQNTSDCEGINQGKATYDKTLCRCCNGQIVGLSITCSNCQFQLCSTRCSQECCSCGKCFCQFCTVLK